MRGPIVDVYLGDVLDRLRGIPDKSFQMAVTSPPYWNLRDYKVDGQIGHEASPQAYVKRLVRVFRELRRTLRDDGVLWLNLGDTYVGSARGNKPGDISTSSLTNPKRQDGMKRGNKQRVAGLKEKDMVGIPWMVAFALRADGWYLRNDIIWHKRNPMPASAKDRSTVCHEYVFLFSKKERYFYDGEAIKEPAVQSGSQKRDFSVGGWASDQDGKVPHTPMDWNRSERRRTARSTSGQPLMRNSRSVWHINTVPYWDAHFATFPPALPRRCILAGSSPQACEKCGAPFERILEKRVVDRTELPEDHPEWRPKKYDYGKAFDSEGQGGVGRRYSITTTKGWKKTCRCLFVKGTGRSVVLDPFGGSGTTAMVALELGRDAALIELSPEYLEMIKRRVEPVAMKGAFFSLDTVRIHA